MFPDVAGSPQDSLGVFRALQSWCPPELSAIGCCRILPDVFRVPLRTHWSGPQSLSDILGCPQVWFSVADIARSPRGTLNSDLEDSRCFQVSWRSEVRRPVGSKCLPGQFWTADKVEGRQPSLDHHGVSLDPFINLLGVFSSKFRFSQLRMSRL